MSFRQNDCTGKKLFGRQGQIACNNFINFKRVSLSSFRMINGIVVLLAMCFGYSQALFCCCSGIELFLCFFLFRLVKLLNEIMQEKQNKTIIFVETKRKADDIARRMKRDGCVCLLLCFFPNVNMMMLKTYTLRIAALSISQGSCMQFVNF